MSLYLFVSLFFLVDLESVAFSLVCFCFQNPFLVVPSLLYCWGAGRGVPDFHDWLEYSKIIICKN